MPRRIVDGSRTALVATFWAILWLPLAGCSEDAPAKEKRGPADAGQEPTADQGGLPDEGFPPDAGQPPDEGPDGGGGGCATWEEEIDGGCRARACVDDGACGPERLCGPTGRCDLLPCQGDGDCAPAEACDQGTGRCVLRSSCDGDGQCAAGQYCHPVLGACVPGCSGDGACAGGERCNLELHRCEAGPCDDDAQCREGMFCAAPPGVCREGCRGGDPDPCPAGQSCDGPTGLCTGAPCGEDGDCPVEQYCAAGDGRCALGCRASAFCPQGAACDPDSRRCGPPPCRDDGDCPIGEYCAPDLAQCRPGCTADEDCAGGERCDIASHLCHAGPCAGDGECPVTHHCSPALGLCLQGCQRDDGCAPGERCDVAVHTCRPGCAVDGDCPEDQYCEPVQSTCRLGCRADGCPDELVCNLLSRQCEEVGGPCAGDEECAEGSYCALESGECLPGCRVDGPGCPDGTRCDPARRVCVRERCASDEDCLPEQTCDQVLGECVSPCAADGDCEPGLYCDLASRLCEVGCRLDGSGCSDDQPCDEVSRSCGCTGEEDCAAGLRCLDGRCLAVCEADQDCPAEQYCNRAAGRCTVGCRDDGFEDNDRSEQPWLLAGPGPWAALRICPGDEDWYALPLTAGQQLSATIRFLHAAGNLDLEAYVDGQVVAASASEADEERIELAAAAAEVRVLLRVFGQGRVQVDYTLSVAVQAAGDCAPDPGEPNNGAAVATPIAAGDHAGLQLCPGDEDWYRIRTFPGTRLTAELYLLGGGNLDLDLYGPGGEARLAASRTLQAIESVSLVTLDDGNHFLRVFSPVPDERGRPYRLVVRLGPEVGACPEDRAEPDDRREEATSLAVAPGHDEQLRRYLCPGDSDWFSVAVAAQQGVRARLDAPLAGAELVLTLLRPDGTTVVGQAEGVGQLAVEGRGLAAGTYYLRVTGLREDVASPYVLSAGVDPPGACPGDRLEPNDLRAQAVALGDGLHADLRICPADEDWYAIELQAGGSLDLVVVCAANGSQIDMEIRNPAGAVVVEEWGDGGQTRGRVGNARAGVYLVRLSSWDAGATIPYTAMVTVRGSQCVDDPLEPNDVAQDATPLLPGRRLEGMICSPDEDWFVVAVGAGQPRLGALLEFYHFQGDLDLFLHGPDGQQLAQSVGGEDNERITSGGLAAGSYYLRVRGVPGTQNRYAISATLGP